MVASTQLHHRVCRSNPRHSVSPAPARPRHEGPAASFTPVIGHQLFRHWIATRFHVTHHVVACLRKHSSTRTYDSNHLAQFPPVSHGYRWVVPLKSWCEPCGCTESGLRGLMFIARQVQDSVLQSLRSQRWFDIFRNRLAGCCSVRRHNDNAILTFRQTWVLLQDSQTNHPALVLAKSDAYQTMQATFQENASSHMYSFRQSWSQPDPATSYVTGKSGKCSDVDTSHDACICTKTMRSIDYSLESALAVSVLILKPVRG